MNIFKSLALMLVVMFTTATFGQATLKGIVQDADTDETLVGASIIVKGSNLGITTGIDGDFTFNVPAGSQVIKISYMGYEEIEKQVKITAGKTTNLGVIKLNALSIGLAEVQILADVAIDRKTPVAVSTIKSEVIEKNLGSQEFPELLKNTPSVYPTKQGGGFGDASINIRGFDQRNIGVLVNGIPVNDMENGWVYWSNWSGIGDATRTVQVQRGLGASKLAINSVGGTINIITKTTDMKKGGSLKAEFTDFGRKKTTLTLSTGNMKSGTAITFVGSRTTGQGYIDACYTDAWSYFLSASQEINKDHRLVFTLVGAPQKHGQRDSYELITQEEYDKYGTKYNKNWGYLYGEKLSYKNNYYHKPQAALNWYWTINETSFLATSVYLSAGNGGGSGTLTKYKTPYDFDEIRRPYQQLIDFDSIAEINAKEKSSQYILRNSVNNHLWYGALSTYSKNLTEDLTLMAGIDARYYKGEHYREVRDLLGGDYFEDRKNKRAKIGDKIAYHNDGIVQYAGAFSQIEYSSGNLAAFLAGTVSNTWNQRIDYYNYDYTVGNESKQLSDIGYNGKLGVNYNINENLNVFANGGYYSRVPIFKFLFLNYKNDVNEDRVNEKVLAGEIGAGFKNSFMSIHVDGYYTTWKDINRIGKFKDKNNKKRSAYYYGLEEVHYGVEAEIKLKPIKNLTLGLAGGYGIWYYANSPLARVNFDDNVNSFNTFRVNLKDVYVPNQPQTSVSFSADYKINDFDFGANWNFYDRLYTNFNVDSRAIDINNSNPNKDFGQSYRLPSYNTLDMRAGWNFKIAGLKSYAAINCYNVLNTEAIVYGEERIVNNEHFFDSGFWTWGRNFNFSLKVNF
ncbi:MAG: TonB-dependent receptor [Hyphomicrobiales bacterium]